MSDADEFGLRYYDRDGQPITRERFIALKYGDDGNGDDGDGGYKRVALDVLDDGRAVSTVWLGTDDRFVTYDDNGPPLIFETMVFANWCDNTLPMGGGAQWRYSTEAQAIAGHDQVVAALRAGHEPDQ